MKKVVKLKESDLIRIVKRVINESDQNIRYGKVINGRAVWDDEMEDDMDMDMENDMDMDMENDMDMDMENDMNDEMPY